MPILKLDHDDPDRELDFEVRYLLSLTYEQRVALMEEASQRLREQVWTGRDRSRTEIIKRPLDAPSPPS